MAESYPNRSNTLWGKRAIVFKRLVSQGRQTVSLCGNGLNKVLPSFFSGSIYIPRSYDWHAPPVTSTEHYEIVQLHTKYQIIDRYIFHVYPKNIGKTGPWYLTLVQKKTSNNKEYKCERSIMYYSRVKASIKGFCRQTDNAGTKELKFVYLKASKLYKDKKCCLTAFSPLLALFCVGFFLMVIKSPDCVVTGKKAVGLYWKIKITRIHYHIITCFIV